MTYLPDLTCLQTLLSICSSWALLNAESATGEISNRTVLPAQEFKCYGWVTGDTSLSMTWISGFLGFYFIHLLRHKEKLSLFFISRERSILPSTSTIWSLVPGDGWDIGEILLCGPQSLAVQNDPVCAQRHLLGTGSLQQPLDLE